MQSVSVLLRVAFGLALGAAAVVVAPGSYHDLARGLPSIAASHALADTSTCHRFSPDYRFDGDGPGVTNIGAISTPNLCYAAFVHLHRSCRQFR